MVDALGVPERDRYQVVNSHPAGEIVALDTGLGINRSDQLVIIHVVSRRRTRAQKEKLYALLAERLKRDCGLDPADLVVSVSENDDQAWPFGFGRAQFLTGELHRALAALAEQGIRGTALNWVLPLHGLANLAKEE
jgi:phenylpyruvate tautomerase PptA (4-oxalocrotonate tautomerase family)